MINLQLQLYGNNICHRTLKIIQKHLPNFKPSKRVGLGFTTRQTHAEKFYFWKKYCIFEFQNCYIYPLLPVCWHEKATLAKRFIQGQSYSKNNLFKYYIFGRQALKG